MSPEIEKAIEQLDAKIAALQRARDTLVDTFCPPDSPRRKTMVAKEASAISAAATTEEFDPTLPGGMRLRHRLKRKDMVAEYIRRYGPSARADILAGAGLPPGTIANVLSDKSRFVLKDGKWHNVGEGSKAVPLASTEQPSEPETT